jgi:hypothetical protein
MALADFIALQNAKNARPGGWLAGVDVDCATIGQRCFQHRQPC